MDKGPVSIIIIIIKTSVLYQLLKFEKGNIFKRCLFKSKKLKVAFYMETVSQILIFLSFQD